MITSRSFCPLCSRQLQFQWSSDLCPVEFTTSTMMHDISINVKILLEWLFWIESTELYFTSQMSLLFHVNWSRNLSSALAAVHIIFMLSIMLSKLFASLLLKLNCLSEDRLQVHSSKGKSNFKVDYDSTAAPKRPTPNKQFGDLPRSVCLRSTPPYESDFETELSSSPADGVEPFG